MTAPEIICHMKMLLRCTPQEMVKRKIEAIDKLISPAEILYELYGLTEVKIKIVEGK